MTRPRILVADDKENIIKLVATILGPAFEVVGAHDGTRALACITAEVFDVVLTDLKMPGAGGLVVLHETRRLHPDTEVIMMTAYGTVSDAVAAMKEGAFDYLTKPFEPDEVLLTVQRAVERRRLRSQARDLRAALEGSHRFEHLISNSAPMKDVVDAMRRAAQTSAPVLVTGEAGTGKEVVARSIHSASERRSRPFLPVVCGAIPAEQVDVELFAMLDAAEGGTLFLDDVVQLPLAAQVKLNRVLQDANRDVRLIATSQVELKDATTAGRFREDLYFRLAVVTIRVPPLRDRREDIPALAAMFLERHRRGVASRGLTVDALAALVEYDWPRNVRELEYVVQRALASSESPHIGVRALPEDVTAAHPRGLAGTPLEELDYRDMLDHARARATREYLVGILRTFDGNVTQAAEHAGIERESLHRLLKRHGVRSEDFRPRP